MTLEDLRLGRAAISITPRAIWKLTGPDRTRFLNGQTTQDIITLRPGHAVHAAVTNAKGKLDADIWVTHRQDALWLDAPIELRDSLTARLERYLIADDATLEDVTGAWTILHLLQPPPPDNKEAVASARFFLPGHDIWLPAEELAPLPLTSAEFVETLRVAQGVPAWGRDIGPDLLAPEAAFDRDAISYRKGCYIGQEVIARIKSIGRVNKCLTSLRSARGPLPTLPAPIEYEGKIAGHLTSACLHPDQNTRIGLAVLPRPLIEQTAQVLIEGQSWQITSLPLTDSTG